MDTTSTTPFWRRLLDWVFHPAVLAALLIATIYSGWTQNTEATRLSTETTRLLIVVLCIFALAVLGRYYYASRRLLRAMEDVERERDRVWSPQIESERMLLRKAIEDTSSSTFVNITPRESQRAIGRADTTMYVRGLELENIRCFNHLALGLENEDGPYLTTILLGDNAAGKTTVLRSIALALCSESDAVWLMKGLGASFLKKGSEKGAIVLRVRSIEGSFSGEIHIAIEQGPNGEIIRQTTSPSDFPWDHIFVCGYGTHRTSGRPSSHQKYTPREAVGTLFSDTADLLNPEVVLLRRDAETRHRFELILKQILLLESGGGILTTGNGIELGGPWGTLPISAMSDGYRSTSQWVLDYLGWQMFAERLLTTSMDGILLIDELEQHLHPRWQRYIVQRLRAQLDQTQIIASTHTPLVAAGVADLPRSQVIRLVPLADGAVGSIKIPPEDLTGKRADQILADAFGLITSKSPGSVVKIDRYTELLSRERNLGEQHELELLKQELEEGWSSGDHALKREADKAVSKVLDAMIEEGRNKQIVEAQVKQRQQDLFGDAEALVMIRIQFEEPKTKTWERWIRDCTNATAELLKNFSWDKHVERVGVINPAAEPFEISDLYRRKSIKKEVYLLKEGAFRGRCAYCESYITDFQHGEIEHFRPKKGVTDENDTPIVVIGPDGSACKHPGYYWLAYDRRNLLPSCITCNQPGEDNIGKRNRFPLQTPSYAIMASEIGKEEPLLLNPLDPNDDDPEDHLGIDLDSGIDVQVETW